MNRFLINWNLKITALVLAVALWSHVRGEVNPIETAMFSIRLDTPAPANLMVMNQERLPKTVRVTLRAPRATMRELKGGVPSNPLAPPDEAPPLAARFATARLDFSLAKAGQQEIPVKVKNLVEEAEVIGIQPSVMELVLDEQVEQQLPVKAVLEGALEEGWYVDRVAVKPDHARVFGPAQILARVAGLRAPFESSGLVGDLVRSQTCVLVPVDRYGRKVADVRVEPNLAEVSARLRERADTVTVPVEVVVTGQAAPGYETGDVEASPKRVRLRGPRSRLNRISAVTASVSVSGRKSTFSRRVNVEVPEEIKLLDESSVKVTVQIAARAAAPAGVGANPAQEGNHVESQPR